MAATNLTKQFGPIRQLGYVVENIEASVEAWMDHQGVGPWMIIKNVPLACTYKGEKTQPMIDIALAYQGDMQIELIQQTNDQPSPYLYYFENNLLGLHHTAYLCDDVDSAVSTAESHGHNVICDIRMPDGGRYVYTQVEALGEHIYIEFLSATDRMKGMFSEGIKAANSWNGDKNVTVIDMAALDR
ncbi:MAG: VOC family protein [Pseudomonadales bacterium]|nr:VOC family protein [Pseudomonadales bacterium]